MDLVVALLFAIMGAVLVLPFSVKKVEEELEAFLLVMGALAVTVSRQWSGHLVAEALHEPLKITAAVLLFGVIFKYTRGKIRRGVAGLANKIGMGLFLFLLTSVLGLASSVITAIIAALVLVEVISGLRLPKANEERIVVYSCFSIGLGAALTPIGEPLSTIAVSKLAGPPHNADFWFLLRLLGPLIVPGVLIMGALSGIQGTNLVPRSQSLTEDAPERMKDILLRTAKVYVFVAALVLLSTGISPVVDRYVVSMPRALLYWVNSISAVLDNATLAAAEISPRMAREDIEFLLMGLLIAGGMLIPGNIPNIVSAGKLDIKSGAWAKIGVPVGLVLMVLYFILLEVIA